mmetsp:Transcript_6892/g.7841  ORF Transcript_6892/g.7841 Transcript_6892/m.7841 type:complete len:505 (-) Transcript_6892:97-1611(-)
MTRIRATAEHIQHMLQSQISDEPDEDTLKTILVQVFSNILLFLLIFGMSATVDIRRVKEQLRNCYAISTGIGMQFLIMPLLGFIAVISLKDHGLTPPMGITLLIVTASPGGSYSNWWCSLFNADLALSVAMTALSTFISIAALPLNLMLYAHAAYGFNSEDGKNVLASVDFKKLIISLGIVIGAIVSGLFASYKIDNARFHKVANAGGTIAGLALIVFSAVFSSTGGSDAKPWNQHWSFYVGVALPCVIGLAIANFLARLAKLEKPEVVTLSVECAYQNVGIATSAALAMFKDPDEVAQAMAVPLFYGLVEMFVLGLYCLVAWKLDWTKAPKDESICVVMSTTYEIVDGDEVTALQDSVPTNNEDPDHGDDSDKELGNRDRVDTLVSEDSLIMSVSDISSNLSFGTRKENDDSPPYDGPMHHVRSLPGRFTPSDVPKTTVFHTINEESDAPIEVVDNAELKKSTNQQNPILRFLSLKGEHVDYVTAKRRSDSDSDPNIRENLEL